MLPNFCITQGRRALGVFFVATLLVGCAARPVLEPVAALDWQQRQQQLAGLDSWSFNGRLAIRDSQDESWSASLRWSQRAGSYDIHISGAFGQGAARMSGYDGYAVIETPDQAALTATSAEALMQQQLGWHMPVAQLRYWLLGAPGPGLAERHSFDEAGRLQSLEKLGWQVRYRNYMNVGGMELPRKLELENPRLRARLVIDRWDLNPKTEG